MLSLICEEPGKLVYKEIDIPPLKPGEVLLKINRVGICGTDLHAFEGTQPYFTYPRIFGHELGAEIANANGHTQFSVADPVTIIPYFNCHHCQACRNGKPNCCSSLRVAGVHTDGGLQEYFAVPAESVLQVNGLTPDQLAVIEPLAVGEHAVERASPEPGETILILGAGPIGVGIAMMAVQRGCRTIIADPDSGRISNCKNLAGVSAINMSEQDITTTLFSLSPQGASIIFDATGNLKAIESTLGLLSHGGKIILVGLQKNSFSFSHPEFHKKETTLMSSRNAVRRNFEQVISYLEEEKIVVSGYITHQLSFTEAAGRFGSLTDKKNKVLKAIIHFQ